MKSVSWKGSAAADVLVFMLALLTAEEDVEGATFSSAFLDDIPSVLY